MQRFSDMMEEMCHLVATKHSGSLKGEHGTGEAERAESGMFVGVGRMATARRRNGLQCRARS